VRTPLIGFKAVLLGSTLALIAAASAGAYPVTCIDGTTSQAGGKQGACSHHGGVAGGGSVGGGGSTGGGGVIGGDPLPPPAPPVDLLPPTVTVVSTTTPATVGMGRPFTPPSVTVTDDVAWPTASYTATVDWGDGTNTAVSFAGISSPSVSVPITLPPHAYALPGHFNVSVTIVDPASHVTTTPVTTPAIVPALAPGAGFPRLVGTPMVGRTLTCKPGYWGDKDAQIEFRWKANGTRIPDFSDKTFRVRRRDQGRRLTCQVIEHNDAFVARATSNALQIRKVRSALVRGK
jgi:hypothetical protein